MKGWHLALLLAFILGAVLALQIRRLDQRWEASRILRTVEAVTERVRAGGTAVPPAVRQQLLQRNLEILKRAAEQAPDEVTTLVLRGGQYSLLGRQELALRSYRQALALEPRAEIYLNLGHLHWSREERDEARRAFALAGFLDHSAVPGLRKFFAAGQRPWGRPRQTLPPLLEAEDPAPDAGESGDDKASFRGLPAELIGAGPASKTYERLATSGQRGAMG